MKKNLFKFTSLILSLLFINSILSAKPVTIVGEPQEKPVSISAISHSDFDALLKKYVDENGDVNYTDWKNDDKETLKNYLESYSRADPSKKSSKNHQLAFWINAYNALTIHGILDKYPTSTIRNHTAKVFGYNIWKDLKVTVGDAAYSLDQIEHEILRKMDEPRIHFAIVCASHSCPKLLNGAFDAHKLEEQLDQNAVDFFANPENFTLAGNKVKLSSILDWFGEDFGDNRLEVLKAVVPYLPEDDADTITDAEGGLKVSYLPYSWKLNDLKTAKKRRK